MMISSRKEEPEGLDNCLRQSRKVLGNPDQRRWQRMPECGTVFPGVEVYTEELLAQTPLYWSRTARAHIDVNNL